MMVSLFQTELLFQCKVLLLAADDLDKSLIRRNEIGTPKSPAEMYKMEQQNQAMEDSWFALQQLLTAGATISRLLWGQTEGQGASRKGLRSIISVDDSSPLKERHLRNDWEHIDEKIECWWDKTDRHHIAIRNFSTGKMGLAEKEEFLTFDPTTRTVIFWGHVASVRAIVDAARAMLPRLEAALKTPWWT